MFSKRRFRRNKPRSQNFLENGEQQKEAPFIPPVQTKLNIGKPGDVYEVEADKTADAVVNKTAPQDAIQKMGAEEEEVQAKPLSQGLTPFVQKQEASEEEPVQAMREEEPVQAMQEEESVQKQEGEKEEGAVQAKEKEEESVQAKHNSTNKIGNRFEQRLGNQKGQGEKLAAKDRVPLEAAFGADFSGVNIHKGGEADTLNKQLNAKAFTHGADIYFKNGNFDPSSKEGKHLLAHELTHTIQQGAVNAAPRQGNRNTVTTNAVQKADEERGSTALTWKEYTVVETGKSIPNGALTDVHLELKPLTNLINAIWESKGPNIKVTINYRPATAEIVATMNSENSFIEQWITDDVAAIKKYGPDEFERVRALLLEHERLHFQNTEILAVKYDALVKAAVPTTAYIETFVVPENKGTPYIENKFTEIRERESNEIINILREIKNTGNAELKAIQNIYDRDTRHGTDLTNQGAWENDHAKRFEDAMNETNR